MSGARRAAGHHELSQPAADGAAAAGLGPTGGRPDPAEAAVPQRAQRLRGGGRRRGGGGERQQRQQHGRGLGLPGGGLAALGGPHPGAGRPAPAGGGGGGDDGARGRAATGRGGLVGGGGLRLLARQVTRRLLHGRLAFAAAAPQGSPLRRALPPASGGGRLPPAWRRAWLTAARLPRHAAAQNIPQAAALRHAAHTEGEPAKERAGRPLPGGWRGGGGAPRVRRLEREARRGRTVT